MPRARRSECTAWYATPWEILRQLPGLAGHLKPGVTIQDLERESRAKTDTAAAKAMQAAKEKLFISFQQAEDRMKERRRGRFATASRLILR